MSGVGYTHKTPSRAEFDSVIHKVPPHLQVILEATRDGHVSFAHVKQFTGPFTFKPGRPCILLIGDDYSLSWGPQAFDRPSLDRFIRHAASAVVVSGAAERKVYAAAVAGAILSGRDAIIVESVERWEADWVALIQAAAPGIPTLISTPRPSGARH